MNITRTELDGVLLLQPRLWTDRRGSFFESYNRRDFAAAGMGMEFVQDNHSTSWRGTVRGLHYQAPPHAQDKLVRTLVGEVYDVVLDLRRGSPTYGRWQAFTLSAANRLTLFVPKGFAHGFCVLSETADILYKCSAFYAPDAACGVSWNDPDLAIPWPVREPLLSEQDRRHPPLAAVSSPFAYEGPPVGGVRLGTGEHP